MPLNRPLPLRSVTAAMPPRVALLMLPPELLLHIFRDLGAEIVSSFCTIVASPHCHLGLQDDEGKCSVP